MSNLYVLLKTKLKIVSMSSCLSNFTQNGAISSLQKKRKLGRGLSVCCAFFGNDAVLVSEGQQFRMTVNNPGSPQQRKDNILHWTEKDIHLKIET